MDNLDALKQQAEHIRASGLLGQSRLFKLFDFLVQCSAAGTAPKEAVIAAEVFSKDAAFDVSQDSIVRVYIHNLRRKLDQFYAGPGKDQRVRLLLPKGEYRLVVVPAEARVPEPDSRPPHSAARKNLLIGAAVVAILTSLTLVGIAIWHSYRNPQDAVRRSPVWSRLLQNGKPIVVVVGDYYIFGDTEQTTDVKRLIREFSINSKDDLDRFLQQKPELAGQFMDVSLGYLPTSSAVAVAAVMPVLVSGDKRRVRVVLMSAMDPNIIKSANIVYVGLLSGLGTLQRLVFAGSRFQVGESFDELIDRKTDHHYFSTANQYAGEPPSLGSRFGYHDYGFFSTFSGLDGNQIVVIAGMQDEGLREMSDALTDPARLDELKKQTAGAPDIEALYEVLGMNSLDLNGKLLLASPLDPTKIWTAR